jgi:(p)ppGpp synthase/HD superfamily hydrolase
MSIFHLDPDSAKLVRQARRFAIDAHESINQRRKYTGLPYILHPIAVAKQVMRVSHDAEMIAAAYLHDTVEDTPVRLIDIHKRFGEGVATLVDELTDVSVPEDGNRKTRKDIDLAHTALISPRGKTIKLADIIDNIRDITQLDPRFAPVYLLEKKRILGVLTEGNQTLLQNAWQIMNNYTHASQKQVCW